MDQITVLVDTIADDSHRLLTAELEAHGVAVLPFCGGGELCDAVNRVKVAGVFLNWSTRYAGGADPVRQLRRSASNKNVPLTMLTDTAATSVVAEGARQGVDFFLSKPLSQSHVARLLSRLLPLMEEERRAYRRVALTMPVLCSFDDQGRRTGESINVSASGMLMSLSPPPPIGARMLLAFGIHELAHEFIVRGDVVRHGPQAVIGVRYDWHSPELHETLKARLDGIRAA